MVVYTAYKRGAVRIIQNLYYVYRLECKLSFQALEMTYYFSGLLRHSSKSWERVPLGLLNSGVKSLTKNSALVEEALAKGEISKNQGPPNLITKRLNFELLFILFVGERS